MAAPDGPGRRGEQLAAARTSVSDTGRVNQKLRTRQALLAAAKELVDAGGTPTLAEVAERALVSKTTAYRYFASAEDLITEVFFDRNFPTLDTVFTSVGDDPSERVLAVAAAVNEALLTNELAMRMIVRNSLDVDLAANEDPPVRTGRRKALIAAALRPLDDVLAPAALERLQHALALVIGPEAIIAARDVCGLTPEQTMEVTSWAAAALLASAASSPHGQAHGPTTPRRNRRQPPRDDR